jgi:hypothetical protein
MIFQRPFLLSINKNAVQPRKHPARNERYREQAGRSSVSRPHRQYASTRALMLMTKLLPREAA